MSGYESVARHMAAAAGNLRPAHKSSTSGLMMAAASSAADLTHQSRRRERSWRVLISIGLILPALAAIIGIVAYAISIEVANGSQTGGYHQAAPASANAHRKLNHHQQPQTLQQSRQQQQQQQHRHEAQVMQQSRRQPHEQQHQSSGPIVLTTMPRQSGGSPAAGGAALDAATKITIANGAQNSNGKYIIVDKHQQAPSKHTQTNHKHQPAHTNDNNLADRQKPQAAKNNEANEDNDEPASDAMANNGASADESQPDEPRASESEEQPEGTTSAATTTTTPAPTTTTAATTTTTTTAEPPQFSAAPVAKSRRNNKSQLDRRPAKQGRGREPEAEAEAEEMDGSVDEQEQEEGREIERGGPAPSNDGDDVDDEDESKPRQRKLKSQRRQQQRISNMMRLMMMADDNRETDPVAPIRSSKLIPTTTTTTTTQAPTAAASAKGKKRSNKQIDNREDLDESAGFEAIASAISNSLASGAQSSSVPVASSLLSGSPLEGDTGTGGGAFESDSSQRAPLFQYNQPPSRGFGQVLRRRTPGEHVADVIDHIVEQRKQGQLAAQPSQLSGPQIVVVAPVGGSAHLKARSLTREDESKPMKRQEGAKAGEPGAKKSSWPGEKKRRPDERKSAQRPIIGARLLGSDPVSGADGATKFSERVEVIEDDDSSSLLMKSAANEEDEEGARPQQQQLEPERRQQDGDDVSSIHVSSHASEARLRSPRHELGVGRMFERYARPLIGDNRQQQQQRAVPLQSQPPSQPQPQHQPQQQQQQQQQPHHSSQAKLYSAEQLIREHVLKSKTKHSAPARQQPLAASVSSTARPAPQGAASEAPAMVASASEHHQQVAQAVAAPPQQQQASINDQVKMIPTTVRPQSRPQQQQQQPSSTESAPKESSTAGSQSAGLAGQMGVMPSQMDERQLRQQYQSQAYASGVHPVQVPLLVQNFQQPMRHQDHYQPSQYQQHQADITYQESQQQARYQQAQPQPQQEAERQQMEQQQQLQQQHQMPVFADQEFNVPAHMAESVIQDIQRSPSAIGVVNGQPTLFSVARQVPFQYQAESGAVPAMQPAASMQHPQHLRNQNYHQPAIQLPAPFGRARPAWASEQQLQQYARQHQQQVLANRNSVEPAPAASPPIQPAQGQSAAAGPPPSAGAGGPRSLVRPVAQMALRHLFSSLAGPQQAADSAVQQAPDSSSARSMASQPAAAQQLQPDSAQASGSQPAASVVLPPEAGADFAGRQMRSLAPGAEVQEAQESYGQMPTYSMGGGGGYGGQHHGGGYGYESEHDKKSKGVTFHFGGGPIGGGTQLITSPMGIFKHLMIPLLPNPRVNLNGKVVFGVVLEKTTAFGSPPKKKHKFWGR